MKHPPREFSSLTENMQEKIYSLLVEKYRMQDKENPGNRAWRKIREQGPQSYEAWQRLNFFSMQAIDKCLEEQGLPRKHFQRA
jgi:hypothetical protein